MFTSPFVTYYCMSNTLLSPPPQAAVEAAAAAGWVSPRKWLERCVERPHVENGPIQRSSHTSR